MTLENISPEDGIRSQNILSGLRALLPATVASIILGSGATAEEDFSSEDIVRGTVITVGGMLSDRSGGGFHMNIIPKDMGCFETGLCNLAFNPKIQQGILQNTELMNIILEGLLGEK